MKFLLLTPFRTLPTRTDKLKSLIKHLYYAQEDYFINQQILNFIMLLVLRKSLAVK